MFYSQYPYNYRGRANEYVREPELSFTDLYLEMVKYGFSTTEFPLMYSLQKITEAQQDTASGLLTKEQFEASPFYNESLTYRQGMTQAELELLSERAKKERDLAEIYSQANSAGDWTAIIGGMITGSLPSVLNVMPTVSAIPRIQKILAASKASKLAKQGLVGAADATAATALYQLPYSIERREYQLDYDWQHAATDLAIAAGLGGTIGAALGRFRIPKRSELDEFADIPEPISTIDTINGLQYQRSSIYQRIRAAQVAQKQAAVDEPINVNAELVPEATNKEIQIAQEKQLSTTPDLEPIVPVTVQQKNLANDANNVSDEIVIFDTEETRIVAQDQLGSEQVLIVPLNEKSFGKYFKHLQRHHDPKKSKDAPRQENEMPKGMTYEEYPDVYKQDGGFIYLTKQKGDKDYRVEYVGTKQDMTNELGNRSVLQVDRFNNSFASKFKKIPANDQEGVANLLAEIKATRYNLPSKQQQPNTQVAVEPESTFEPTQYDPAKHDPILADANKELDAELANRDLTNEEASELANVDKSYDEMIEASDDLHNSVAACVFKNARV